MGAQQSLFLRFRLAPMLAAAVFGAAGPEICAAADQGVKISRHDCENLNTRNADIPAAYQPGVDARGKPVTGADIAPAAGAGLKLPDEITVPVSLDLARRYDMGDEINAHAGLFTVSVKNGEVRLGGEHLGERLGEKAETAVKRACLDAYGG